MFSLNQQGDLLSAPPDLWKASRVQKKLHEQHGPNGAASGWPVTGARYCWIFFTGIQGGKLSTAKKIQFLQEPVASLWTLFSFSTVKFRVMSSLNRIACLFLSLQFSLIHCDSVTCIYPLQYTLTQSPIHTCFTYCTAYPHTLGQLLRTIKWQYRRKIISIFSWHGRHAWNWPNFY